MVDGRMAFAHHARMKPLAFLLATAVAACPGIAGAQDVTIRSNQPSTLLDKRDDQVRMQVTVNFFLAGPTGDSDEAAKLRDRATRAVYAMAGSECVLVEQSFAKACRLENVNVVLNRQVPGIAGLAGQSEGYLASGTFIMRATPK
jgi:hypothetical protein